MVEEPSGPRPRPWVCHDSLPRRTRMEIQGREKLGPAGRLALTQAVRDGMTLKQAAACFNVSPATAHRWWHRRDAASVEELRTGAWLLDRPSRPHRSPRLLDAAAQERI